MTYLKNGEWGFRIVRRIKIHGRRGRSFFATEWRFHGERTTTEWHSPAISREMMLGALIKWRLPYPAKEAACKRKRKMPVPFACGEWKAFELRYACDTDLSDRYCPRTSYLRTTCNKYRHSSASFIFAVSRAVCDPFFVLFIIIIFFFLINHSGAVDDPLAFNSEIHRSAF